MRGTGYGARSSAAGRLSRPLATSSAPARAKGAHVAAWQHAFRAELAADSGATFAALLLDLEKCFELVPHHLLAEEAGKIGYPLQLLRLSIATYSLPRVLSADGAFSSVVVAERGIAAGSGMATTELRVLLLRLLDGVRAACPQVKLTAYVDDLAVEATRTQREAAGAVTGAGRMLCNGLTGLGLRLSRAGKCVAMATAASTAADIAADLADFGVKAAERAKILGSGAGAGVRRNAAVQQKRWVALLARLGRFATLLRQQISVARLFRTGVTAAFTYGDDIVGVSPSVLETRRRVVASAVANSAAGRSVDATLAFADDNQHQRLDPAYTAHAMPLVRWAEAVWCRWQKPSVLRAAVAKAAAKLARAGCEWMCVTGPSSAVVATAARIGWATDGLTFTTDLGITLDLLVDPPCVVRKEVDAAVQRWRYARLAEPAHEEHALADLYHEADVDGDAMVAMERWNAIDVCTAVVRRLIAPTTTVVDWARGQKNALRSAATNAQWPQQRLVAARLADDNACQMCRLAGIPREGANASFLMPEPLVGTLFHRIATCTINAAYMEHAFLDSVDDSRAVKAMMRCALGSRAHADQQVIAEDSEAVWQLVASPAARHGSRPVPPARVSPPHLAHAVGSDARGAQRHWAAVYRLARVRDLLMGVSRDTWDRAWELAWMSCRRIGAWARIAMPAVSVPPRSGGADGTFQWITPPPTDGIPLHATAYTDGSGFDGNVPQIAVYGWAFVVVDGNGDTVAEAAGATPNWVRTMGEAEAWALVRAAQECPPGTTFVTDCSSVATQVAVGRARATAPSKPMARVMRMLHTLLDDAVAREAVVWMPSHCTAASAMGREKGNGSPLTELDRAANGRADLLAKAQARAIRTPAAVRAAIAARRILAIRVALHVGRATWTACSAADGMARDTTAVSRPVRRDGHVKSASGAPSSHTLDQHRPVRPFLTGGHLLLRELNGGWRCGVCWTSSLCKSRIAHQKCNGDVTARWAERAHTLAGEEAGDAASHSLTATGAVVWCVRCGAYAEHHAVGLAAPCRGPPRGTPTLGGTIASRGSGKGGILRTGLPSVTSLGPLPVRC